MAWRGVAWRGVACGVAWRGVAWRGVAWRGEARRGEARQGKARQGKARQGKARQGEGKKPLHYMWFMFQIGDTNATLAWVAIVHSNKEYDFTELSTFIINQTLDRNCRATLSMEWNVSKRSVFKIDTRLFASVCLFFD